MIVKRDCLNLANLPEIPLSQLSSKGLALAKIAWLGDNAAYTTERQTKEICLEVIRLLTQ